MEKLQQFGVVGLGVMGTSLARNLARSGVALSLYNRRVAGVEERVAHRAVADYDELSKARPFEDLSGFVQSLERPRKILAMIPAGPAIDEWLGELVPLLEKGDVVIDGGNSHYRDSERRYNSLHQKGVCFIGMGVSGGEQGALKGPAMMPGGSTEAWSRVKIPLQSIAAKNARGEPCCQWMGKAGAGHFVKTIHNGIEYAEMQLLAEVYFLMRFGQGKTPDEIANVLEAWGQTELDSYLLQITIRILRRREGPGWLLDSILDQAGNKGTGKWTTQIIADLGVPATMIPAALLARFLSAAKPSRLRFAELIKLGGQPLNCSEDDVSRAYQLARLVNHHQGFLLLDAGSSHHNWELDLHQVATVWTQGCIIRSQLMETFASGAFPLSEILFADPVAKEVVASCPALQNLVGQATQAGIPSPCLSAAVNFLVGFAIPNGSANLIQAQRDCFGAHTYRRLDDEEVHHTEW